MTVKSDSSTAQRLAQQLRSCGRDDLARDLSSCFDDAADQRAVIAAHLLRAAVMEAEQHGQYSLAQQIGQIAHDVEETFR